MTLSAPWLDRIRGFRELDLNDEVIKRITGGVLAYAAGDAFGVPFEFKTKRKLTEIATLEVVEGWPFGGVSDDTLLSLLTIQSIKESENVRAATGFLSLLKAALPQLRGLGPTTRSALGLTVNPQEIASIGNTNGGMMRTALLGLAFKAKDSSERRECVTALVSVTHRSLPAIECSIAISALTSALIEFESNLSIKVLREIVTQELIEIQASIIQEFSEFEPNHWSPPEEGISLDPVTTLKAVLYTLANAENCESVFRIACSLGGDTDTVAALSGAVFCIWKNSLHELLEIPWLQDLNWTEIETLVEAIEILSYRRKL